jgi:hypothetical protein
VIPEHFPRDLYWCLLDGQPDLLVPERMLQPRAGSGDLRIDPTCWFAWRSEPPAAMVGRLFSWPGLFDTPWMVWLDDPATGALTPYWLGPGLARALADVEPGAPVQGVLAPEHLAILWNAGVVVTPDHQDLRRAEWARLAQDGGAALARGGLAMMAAPAPAFHIAALRRYYRRLVRVGGLRLGDTQTRGRYIAYDEPVARFLLDQLTRSVSDFAGALLEPSYTYVSIYQGGADLPEHTDRDACEYTLSLCFEASPEWPGQAPWPLFVRTPSQVVALPLELGQAVLFRGRRLSHWREPLPEGHTYGSILFHYVPRS